MKISNNALNFLLAQYRAIFKRAYVKGIASAVLLTAGLAAGQAQAATTTYDSLADIDAVNGTEINFDGINDRLILNVSNTSNATNVLNKDLNIELNGENNQYIVGSGTPQADDDHNSILNGNGHNITITGSNDDDAREFYFGLASVQPKLQITDLDTLKIDGAKVSLVTPTSGSNSGGVQAGVDVGAKNVVITNGAQVNLNNNTAKTGNKANTILRGLNMEISGEDTVVNVGNVNLTGSSTTNNTKAVLGWEHKFDKNGNETLVNQNSDANNKVLGGTKGYAAQVQGNTLNATNAEINIYADHNLSGAGGNYGGAGAILGVHESTLTNSYLTIEDEATLNLEMREFNKDAYYKANSQGHTGRDYNGSLTINGGVVVVDGVLRHNKGGLLEISDTTQLTGGEGVITPTSGEETKSEHKLDNAIFVGIYGDAANPSLNSSTSGSFDNSTLATLRLSSNKLNEFLNSKDEDIKDKAGEKITDNQGQLLVHHGARIEFTDQQQVEMSKFVFNNKAGAGHIATTIGGKDDNGTSTIDATIGSSTDKTQVDGVRRSAKAC